MSRALLLLLPRAVSSGPPPPSTASDSFTGVDGTDLVAHNANWALSTGNFSLFSNALYPHTGFDECGAAWTGLGVLTDQYAQATLISLDSGGLNEVGVGVRVSSVAATYYGFYVAKNYRGLFRRVNGSWDELASDSVTCIPGDVLRLEVVGTTLTAKVNGVAVLTASDGNITDGYPGVTGFSTLVDQQDTRIDDFTAGTL